MSVPTDELTGTQRAVLLVLMAEARPVRNPELAALGPRLDKAGRDSLVRRGLIEITAHRPALEFELTDAGWATCAALIGADTPDRSSGQGRAFYTVLGGLRRYFDRADLAPADVFLPPDDPSPDGASPDVASPDVEAQVRAAYAGLASRAGGWVDLARLRRELADVPRHDLDETLIRMYRIPGVSLVPEENQKTLTADDTAAAICIGTQAKHLIAIEG